jgi:hypothetical protein
MPKLGLGLGIDNTISLSAAFTTEYQAILARGTALGYTLPSADTQIKQNQLVFNLKAAGTWDKLDVLYIYGNGAASSNFALINWKNPNVSLSTITGSLTFGNLGFTGAASSYIDTNYNPVTNGVKYKTDSASAGIWKFLNNNTATKFMYGNSGSFNNTPGDSGASAAVRIMTFNTFVGAVQTGVNNQATGLLIANKLNNTGSPTVRGTNNFAFYSGGAYQIRDTENEALTSGNYSVFAYAPIAGALPSTYLGGIGSFFAGESFTSDQSLGFDAAMTIYFNSL